MKSLVPVVPMTDKGCPYLYYGFHDICGRTRIEFLDSSNYKHI